MKRFLITIIVVIALCGCSAPEQSDGTPSERNNTIESTSADELEIMDTTGTWGTPPKVMLDKKVEVIEDGEGMVPLLFVETDIYKDRAYVLAAGKEGNIYYADQFEYDGEPLYGEYLFEGRMILKDEPATSPIMEEHRLLGFQNACGDSFTTTHQGLRTRGETAVEHIYVLVQLHENGVRTDGLYLGSYADVNMFPQDAEYSEQSVLVDLDRNGVKDCVTWELIEKEPFEFEPLDYSDYLYDYKVTIEQNGKVYTVENDQSTSVLKNGMAVFVADADQDADFEVIIYEKNGLNARDVMIYDFDGTTYVLRKACPVTIMN